MRETSASKDETRNQTKNYVSGDRMPSSSGHKFKNNERNTSEENLKSSTRDKSK